MKFGQNCEIWSRSRNLVEIQHILSKLFGMAWYGLVEILKLHIGSGRLSVGSGRFSLGSGRLCGGMGLKLGGWVGQMGG